LYAWSRRLAERLQGGHLGRSLFGGEDRPPDKNASPSPPRAAASSALSPLALARRTALLEIAFVKTSHSTFLAAIFLSVALAASARADPNWQTDYKKAQDEAKTNKKLLLVDFTGSDWCGYCIRLNREILSKPQFKDYANKNLVLVEIDFPRAKQQSATLKEQNERLAQEYRIEGFPTIVVLNGEGKKVWRYDGYFSNGAEAFIAELEKLRKG
jgi:protein disulfide-isomerase